MERIVDLTHLINDCMSVYPGDEQTKLYQTQFLKIDKFNNHRLEISMHSGTHIDSPMHLTDREEYIYQFPLENFIGNGCVIDVRNQSLIKLKDEYKEKITENSIVLLYTGFNRIFGTDKYFEQHPIIDMELVELFVEKKVKLVGIDSPSPDKDPFEIHKKLFDNNILILENLTNLEQLISIDNFEVIAFPLKIKADSSILRVVARTL
ncbi:cyclase [Clostridium polyendosporum]|uniref:Cyclase n=1 Tax=Clostridium polyendosporum TaxID=69208 RepID=A0A919RXJ6_9CLOT|nr:cyclase family protein [Clostridium polyendosporum]GIM28119.1 cyclase [Clostridium polyendosporum]